MQWHTRPSACKAHHVIVRWAAYTRWCSKTLHEAEDPFGLHVCAPYRTASCLWYVRTGHIPGHIYHQGAQHEVGRGNTVIHLPRNLRQLGMAELGNLPQVA